MSYQVIYADPPWSYRNKHTGGSMKSGSVDHYPTMTTEDICRLPVPKIAAKDSVLFLWSTVPMLPDALQVLESWKYRYKTMIIWHKTGRLGLGYWLRGEVEILLLGTRGKVKAFRCQHPNIIEAPVGKHSQKPEEFRRLIESVSPEMSRIELFARIKTPGWDVWGLEVENDVELIDQVTIGNLEVG